MIPSVTLISRTQVEWPTLKGTVAKVVGYSPASIFDQYPVKLSEQAQYLVYAACLHLDTPNIDPLHILRHLPHEMLDFLHYSFLIGCTDEVMRDLREKTRAHLSIVDLGKGYCILGTGPLGVWYDAIVLNLTHPQLALKSLNNTRILLDKIMLLFEREGLQHVFYPYTKKTLPDKTFLLE